MASGRMTLIIDGVVLRGDGAELQSLRGLLVGPRGSEQEVLIHIDPCGWQITAFCRSPGSIPPFVREDTYAAAGETMPRRLLKKNKK